RETIAKARDCCYNGMIIITNALWLISDNGDDVDDVDECCSGKRQQLRPDPNGQRLDHHEDGFNMNFNRCGQTTPGNSQPSGANSNSGTALLDYMETRIKSSKRPLIIFSVIESLISALYIAVVKKNIDKFQSTKNGTFGAGE